MKKRLLGLLLTLFMSVVILAVTPLTASALTYELADAVIVNNVGLDDGYYVLEGSTEAKKGTPPADADYAYFKDRVLYLKNFDITTHRNNLVDSDKWIKCGIGMYQYVNLYWDDSYLGSLFNDFPLTIHLTGTNRITDSLADYSIYACYNATVTFTGNGTLEMNRPMEVSAGTTVKSGTVRMIESGTADKVPMIKTENFKMEGGELNMRAAYRSGIECTDFIMSSGKLDLNVLGNSQYTGSGLLTTGGVSFNGGMAKIQSDGDAVQCSSLSIQDGVDNLKFISNAASEQDSNYMAVDTSYVTLATSLKTMVSDNTDGSGVTALPNNYTGNLAGNDYIEVMRCWTINGTISGVTNTTKTTVELYKSGSSTPIATKTVTGNGSYTFENVVAGSYTVKATAEGYFAESKSFKITTGTEAVHPSLVMRKLDVDFQSIYPAPTSMELTNKYTDLGTMDLGSADTNIEFRAFPKELPADTIAEGWTTGRSISVTRDGVEIYNRTYASNEVFGWNLKDNIDEGGTYVITLRVYAQKGEQIVEKTHKFRVFVKGSTIKTLTAEGIGTPIIGKSPSTINSAICNTAGAYISSVEWQRAEEDSYSGWVLMGSREKFLAGERYMVTLTFKTNDGYSFAANAADMSAYINGVAATVVENPYFTNKAYVDLEFTPVDTPAFTTQPVGGEAPYGGTYTVNWATNFVPVKQQLVKYDEGSTGRPFYTKEDIDASATSCAVALGHDYYRIYSYYNDTEYVFSDQFYVTEAAQTHTVTFKVGTTTVDTKTVEDGKTVTAPADPTQSGKTFLGWYTQGGTKFDFTTPITADITLTAKFEDVKQPPQFEDVQPGAYYADAVQWAVEQGITNGYGSDTTFCPDITCTRGQVVTFLWRAKGSPEPGSSVNPFTDIKESDYYYKAVLWAVEQGITNGYGSDTIFKPDGECTRGQVATFLWRAQGKPGMSGAVNPFTDVSAGEYYYDAVLWAVANGITNGYGGSTTFAPDISCSRGQIVTFLYRALK